MKKIMCIWLLLAAMNCLGELTPTPHIRLQNILNSDKPRHVNRLLAEIAQANFLQKNFEGTLNIIPLNVFYSDHFYILGVNVKMLQDVRFVSEGKVVVGAVIGDSGEKIASNISMRAFSNLLDEERIKKMQ